MLEQLSAFIDHQLAVILAEISDMRLGPRCLNDAGQPAVGFISGHVSTQVEPVECLMRLLPECAEPVIRKAAHRFVGTGMYPHIRIAFRIPGADIEHRIVLILFVDAIRTAQLNRAFAVGAAHTAHAGHIGKRVACLVLLHHPFPFFPHGIKKAGKLPKDKQSQGG